MTTTINASTTAGAVITSDTSGVLALQNNGTTAVTVNNGNVGLGTTSPSYPLDVQNSAGVGINIYNTSTTSNDTSPAQLQSFNGTYWNYLYSNFSSYRWNTYNSERMRLDSSGNLLVGGTSAAHSGKIEIFNNGATSNALVSNDSSSSGTSYPVQFYRNGSSVGNISTTTTNTTYGTSSDYRLKENVQPMTGALDKVAQLKPVTYDWISDKSKGQGFIAHELQAVVPDCVTGQKDAVDAEGKPIYQGVDTSFLVATLTAAIQELKATIDAQANALATQATEITALQAQVKALTPATPTTGTAS